MGGWLAAAKCTAPQLVPVANSVACHPEVRAPPEKKATAEKSAKNITKEQRVAQVEKPEVKREQRKLKVEKVLGNIHPGYRTMIRKSLLDLGNDVSLRDMLQYIVANFIPSNIYGENKVKSYLAHAVKKGVKNGELARTPANRISLSKAYMEEIRSAERVESDDEMDGDDVDFEMFRSFLAEFEDGEETEDEDEPQEPVRRKKNNLPKINDSDVFLLEKNGSRQSKRAMSKKFIDWQSMGDVDSSFNSENGAARPSCSTGPEHKSKENCRGDAGDYPSHCH